METRLTFRLDGLKGLRMGEIASGCDAIILRLRSGCLPIILRPNITFGNQLSLRVHYVLLILRLRTSPSSLVFARDVAQEAYFFIFKGF